MKRIWLVLAIILLIGFIVNSCSDEEKEPPVCNLGAHLGIGETCNGNNCILQDYRTAEQKATFPKEINRYGKKTNYSDTELRQTTDKIVAAFDKIASDNGDKVLYDIVLSKIGKLYVVKAANGYYTWNKTDFGADPAATMEIISGRLVLTASSLPEASIASGLAQLQPVSDIRLAKGKKQTDYLSFIDYIGNLKYATVVYKKL